MSYLLIEGFEAYPNINGSADGLQGRWLSAGGYGNLNLSAGRFGGQSLFINGTDNSNGAMQFALTPVGSGTSTFCLGVAYYMASVTPSNIIILSLFNGGASGASPPCGILGIGVNTSQQPYIYVGSYTAGYNNQQPNLPVIGATSTKSMPTGSWHYLELVGTINSSTGSLVLYQDGFQVASMTGNTGIQTADTLSLGGGNFNAAGGYDDLYVTNTAARVGEQRVQTLAVNADNSVSWASTGSSNYSQINSIPVPANPSTNVNTETVGATDLYNVKQLTGVPTAISAVQVHLVGSKQDAGTRIIAPVIKSGSTEAVGANAALTNSYQHYVNVYNVDPNTGSSWTGNSVNAVLIGQTLIA